MKLLKFSEKSKAPLNFYYSPVKATEGLPHEKTAFSSVHNLIMNLKMTITCRVENWALHSGRVIS